MAQGTVLVFDATVSEALKGLIGNLATGATKLGLITDAITPDVTDALPHFGGSGTTNYVSAQTSGGEIPTGGYVFTTPAVNAISGGANFDTENINVDPNPANPTAVRWGILYNDTLATKRAILFLDFGSNTTLVNGAVITIDAGGWFDIT
jgi:hypothetical protein